MFIILNFFFIPKFYNNFWNVITRLNHSQMYFQIYFQVSLQLIVIPFRFPFKIVSPVPYNVFPQFFHSFSRYPSPVSSNSSLTVFFLRVPDSRIKIRSVIKSSKFFEKAYHPKISTVPVSTLMYNTWLPNSTQYTSTAQSNVLSVF